MAERRMISLKVIDTDKFLDMPLSTRYLYHELNARADDDGFIGSPKKIAKMVGGSDDDLRILAAKEFIIPFQSGVIVIKHWRLSNYIPPDRYKSTIYLEEKSLLQLDQSKEYQFSVDNLSTECIPDCNQLVDTLDTQVRLGKGSIGKDKTSYPSGENDGFEKFWSMYPRKIGKGAAEKAFKKYKPDDDLLATMLTALSAQKRSEQWAKDGGQFIPYPATWLNQRRWEDVPEKKESGWKPL